MQHILFPSLFLMASQLVVTLNLKCTWKRIVGNIIYVTEVLGHRVFYFSTRALVEKYCWTVSHRVPAPVIILASMQAQRSFTRIVKVQASCLMFTSCQQILMPAVVDMTSAVCLCPLHWTLFSAAHYQQKLFLQGRFPCSRFQWTIGFVSDICSECLAALDRLYLTCHWKMDHSTLQRKEIIQDEWR